VEKARLKAARVRRVRTRPRRPRRPNTPTATPSSWAWTWSRGRWWVAVAVSLGLALAVWFRPLRSVLALVGVVALVFAAFDLAEVVHQLSASEPGLFAIAGLVTLLHLFAAGLAVAAFRAPEAA